MTRKGKLTMGLLLSLLVFCLAGLGHRHFLSVSRNMERADAIVVLGGEHQAKIPAAALRYRNGHVPQILLADDGVFSAWSDKYNRNL